jgi:2-polyprenyl-3-methyl-5-hydroxy-6-metoxy-1,4-benzoquinol methylase
MNAVDLAADRDIDFAGVGLGYDGFRRLAVNPHLSAHGRIGFADAHREGHEAAIFADIGAKLPALAARNRAVLDIGPGCANLPRLLIALCARQGHSLHLLDSPEMLAQLPDSPCVHKIAGAFPACMAADDGIAARQYDAILCYSVLQYLFLDANPFHVVDCAVRLLAPGGAALFGDIPNASKRRRFFASAAGQAHHRAFTGRDEAPELRHLAVEAGRIDDSVLLGMMQRAQSAGCDAYLVPQPAHLPMANRRDDLIIRKP